MKFSKILANLLAVAHAGADDFTDRFVVDINFNIDQTLSHKPSWNSIATSGAWISEPPAQISGAGSFSASSEFNFDNNSNSRIVLTYVDSVKPQHSNKVKFYLRVDKSALSDDTIHVACPEFYRCDLETVEVNREKLSAYARMNVSMRESGDNETSFPDGFAAPEVIINPPTGKFLGWKGRSGQIGFLRYPNLDSSTEPFKYQYLTPCGVAMPAIEEKFISSGHLVGIKPSVKDGVWGIETVNYSKGRTITFNEQLSDHDRLNSEGYPIPLWVFDVEAAPSVDIELSTRFDNSAIIDELADTPTYSRGTVSAIDYAREWADVALDNNSIGYVDVNGDKTLVTYDSTFDSDQIRRLRVTADYQFKNGNTVAIGLIANDDKESPCQVSMITENISLKYRPIVSIKENNVPDCRFKVHWRFDESATGESGEISYVQPPLVDENEIGANLEEVDCQA